jgi:hypothetical protein
MKWEKELIFVDSHSFERMEDYIVSVKCIQLKLRKYGEYYNKKDEKVIGMVLINSRTPFEVSISTFHTNWNAHKKVVRTTPLNFFVKFLLLINIDFLKK